MPYYSGFLCAVPTKNKDAYIASARKAWPIFEEYGCIGTVETWGVDVPDGKLTSFPLATKKTEDETVVFSWMVWPDKTTCDDAWGRMMEDPRMAEMMDMPFDGKRMMWGGFEPIFTAGSAS
ncbi:DUF1428 domain-containing protein [Roseivivax marinus]|nr:DUF1428 domain-containing protein [Roseivivax marinus]